MKATPGDWVVVESTHLSETRRHGQILEVHGPAGDPPYLVRWDDTGSETVFIPGPGAHIMTAEQMREQHSR